MRCAWLVVMVSCKGTVAEERTIGNAKREPAQVLSICPAALEMWPAWPQALMPGCSPPQFSETGYLCIGPCPTPCSVKKITDEGSHTKTTTFTYDSEGRWRSSTSGNHGTNTCIYDGPRLVSCNERDIALHYDTNGRVHEVISSNQSMPFLLATYKGSDLHTINMPPASVAAELVYDSAHRLIEERLEAPAGQFTIRYGYDSHGRLVRQTAPVGGGLNATYDYDPSTGLLAQRVQEWNSGTSTMTYRHDTQRRLREVTTLWALPDKPGAPDVHETVEQRYEYDCRP